MTKPSKPFPTKLIAALMAFAVAGVGSIYLVTSYNIYKYFSWTGFSVDERRLKLGVIAYLIFVFTAILLWVAKNTLKLSRKWYFYTLLFNSVLIFIKFISSVNIYSKLAPNALFSTAIGVLLLYSLGLWIIYAFYKGKILKSLSEKSKDSEDVRLLFAAGLFVFVNAVRIIVFSLPPFSHTPAASYLSSIFRSGGLFLSLLLFLIIFGAIEAFSNVKHDKAKLRNVFILSRCV